MFSLISEFDTVGILVCLHMFVFGYVVEDTIVSVEFFVRYIRTIVLPCLEFDYVIEITMIFYPQSNLVLEHKTSIR